MLGKIEGRRRRGRQRIRWLDSTTDSMDMRSSKFQETVKGMFTHMAHKIHLSGRFLLLANLIYECESWTVKKAEC